MIIVEVLKDFGVKKKGDRFKVDGMIACRLINDKKVKKVDSLEKPKTKPNPKPKKSEKAKK